jgi:hypothetical protein
MRAAFPRTVTVRNDSYAGTPRFLPLPYCGGAVDMPPQMKAVMTDSNFRASTRLRILAGSFFPAARKACSRLAPASVFPEIVRAETRQNNTTTNKNTTYEP